MRKGGREGEGEGKGNRDLEFVRQFFGMKRDFMEGEGKGKEEERKAYRKTQSRDSKF